MSKKKIKLDRRVKKMANNSNWTRNMLRSMGFTATDLVKDLMPNTAEFAQSNSQVTDIIKDVRRNITNRKVMNAQFKNIPGLKTVDEVFKNIKEDIKSGNLNNKDRENSFGNFGDSDFDFGFDSDMFGGDDVVEFLDDESPVNQPPTIIDTMPLARAINSSTEATVTTMMAVADQQMTIETEKLLFNHRSSNAMLEGLTTINDNLATLVKFNSESTTQYHAASMKFYEEMTKMMEKTVKKDYDDYDWSSVNDVFDSSGNVKISEYINRIKSNIKDKKDESMWGFFLDNLTNPMMIEGMVKNPIGTITRVLVPGLVNSTVKTAFKQLDESITSIIPAALARINTFDGEMNPTLENIFKIFSAVSPLLQTPQRQKAPQAPFLPPRHVFAEGNNADRHAPSPAKKVRTFSPPSAPTKAIQNNRLRQARLRLLPAFLRCTLSLQVTAPSAPQGKSGIPLFRDKENIPHSLPRFPAYLTSAPLFAIFWHSTHTWYAHFTF
jgi:hypothetical protein